ncbi:MAG: hypothetical protein ABSF92_10900 [Candidatus Acidiferrales bacterium]
MRKVFLSALAIVLIVALTLGAMFTLVHTTIILSSLVSPVKRGIAFGAELLLGVVLLLGTVWVATHLAVRIFAPRDPDSGTGVRPPGK